MGLALTGDDAEISPTPPGLRRYRTSWAATRRPATSPVCGLIMMGVSVTHIVDLVRRKKPRFSAPEGDAVRPSKMLPTMKDAAGPDRHPQVVPGSRPAGRSTAGDVLEKFDYSRSSGDLRHRLHRPDALGSPSSSPGLPGATPERRHDHPQRRGVARHRGSSSRCHFFNTHLRPESFRWTSWCSQADVRGRAEALQARVSTERLSNGVNSRKHLVEPYPPIVIRASGFCRLDGAGARFRQWFVWIVYAMPLCLFN